MSKKKKNRDPFLIIKHIAYCLAHQPPNENDSDYKDFVEHARFQLSMHKNVLLKDPIWEQYGDEEILVEFYALMFSKSEKLSQEFVVSLGSEDPSSVDWLDEQIRKNKEEVKKQEDLKEIKFTPQTLGD